jgi:uncharacterized protein
MYLTSTTLYNYLQCPHRPWRDLYGPQDEKIKEVNPFVELLWEKGLLHEEEVIKELKEKAIAFEDIDKYPYRERNLKTIEAMKKGVNLIYHGVISHNNLKGVPDLLRKIEDNNYVPIDIKSGRGFEGVDEEKGEEGKPKKYYAVQLALYIEILENLGFSSGKSGLILDIDNNEVQYDLLSPMGKRIKQTYWDYYKNLKDEILPLLKNKTRNQPALTGVCKVCPWHNSCKKWIKKQDDPSLIYYLSRKARDTLQQDLNISNIKELLDLDISEALSLKDQDKSILKGLGEKSLKKIKQRASVLKVIKKPVIYKEFEFPKVGTELFFDIEADPTQDFIYLHGLYVREGSKEEFKYFLADRVDEEEEKLAWQKFWEYINSIKTNYAVYYYAPYEKTVYKNLRKKYPDVISQKELETFFNGENVIDLYTNVVNKYTDWPLSSYSIKDIATYLGFKWRDKTPSGALSIKWFNDYVKTGNKKIMERIVKYNEDDCKATMVVKDGIEKILQSKDRDI